MCDIFLCINIILKLTDRFDCKDIWRINTKKYFEDCNDWFLTLQNLVKNTYYINVIPGFGQSGRPPILLVKQSAKTL